MSFTVNLYHMGDPKNKLDKDLTNQIGSALDCIMLDETTVLDPVIELECELSDVRFCNYIYIQAFNRYYFVENIEAVRYGLYRFKCHVDVLTTYKTAIRTNVGIVKRNEKSHNTYLNDGFFKVYQNPHIVMYEFPSGFSTYEWVLAMAGNAGGVSP